MTPRPKRCPTSSVAEYRAAWLPELVHPAAPAAGNRHKRYPGIAGFELAIVDQIRTRLLVATATNNLVKRKPGEIGELLQWPLLPLWDVFGCLVELRPYPVLDHFVAIGRSELVGLIRGMRIDKKKVSQGQAVEALFTSRKLAVWGHSLEQYFYRFPVIAASDGRPREFFILRFDAEGGLRQQHNSFFAPPRWG
ncbi:hypothetical protein [Desulfurivibrio alkaliphilus]|uniref:Uncharacterized protein n=1 Tax=Desulfurivibrio alkaliphilus (strain DSM 19089 / UNIQEM U267 / AHT2) TaxID=589865 RepID=D6Z684_DESAT|nr:hypothetical protein [Desulfurivibrio alkaliphilus]ADH86849.1 hypothetical protein DaAHT2_2181 [Desulfurivibrio alkaliphilus AHT 2]